MKDPIIRAAHGKHAQSVLFSVKHDLLISAGMDAKVHFWSMPGFGLNRSLEGHANSVNTLSLSPDESLLATGSSDGNVRLWSFPGGEPMQTLEKQVDARFSPDGQKLATIGSNGRVAFWETFDFAQPTLLPKLDKRIFTLAFSADGSWLAVGGTGVVHRYNLVTDRLESPLEGHQDAVPKVIFTPEGRYLLATGAEGALSIWDVAGWNMVNRIALPAKGVLQTALSPDGRQVYVSMDKLIAGYEIASGSQVLEIRLPIKGVYGLDMSPDGTYLANAGADGKIRIWEL
jgi:WD40 repeat protein